MQKVTFVGIVEKGRGEGAKLGFPTVNIPLTDKTISGIFIAHITIDGSLYEAAAYADQKRGALEAHIFDFSENVYGKHVEITLIKKLREEVRFADEDSLKRQIAQDLGETQEYFKAGRESLQ